jgi:hypothetical protein
VSTGVGRYTYWTGLSSSKGHSGSSSQASAAAQQRQSKAAERLEEIEAVRNLETTLLSRHKDHFSLAQPAIAPEPESVDTRAVHRRIRVQELVGISVFRVSERRAAKKRAQAVGEREIEEQEAERVARKKSLQAELNERWEKLNSNDPEIVIDALETAFDDNHDPAAPINCEGNRASIVILFPPQDFVPDKKPALTPTGKPTLKRRTKTEASDLYARAVASTVLATVKEAFAVAPGLEQISTVVARKDARAENPEDFVAAIYAGSFSRERVRGLDWERVDPLEEIFIAPDAMLMRKGSTSTMAPLDLRSEPELRSVVDQLRQSL